MIFQNDLTKVLIHQIEVCGSFPHKVLIFPDRNLPPGFYFQDILFVAAVMISDNRSFHSYEYYADSNSFGSQVN